MAFVGSALQEFRLNVTIAVESSLLFNSLLGRRTSPVVLSFQEAFCLVLLQVLKLPGVWVFSLLISSQALGKEALRKLSRTSAANASIIAKAQVLEQRKQFVFVSVARPNSLGDRFSKAAACGLCEYVQIFSRISGRTLAMVFSQASSAMSRAAQ